MSEQKSELKAKLVQTRTYLNDVLDQVGERWETQVHTQEGGWTVRQLVNHIASADRGHINMVKGIAEGVEVVPADFDLERYNRRTTEKTADKAAPLSRQELEQQRAELLEWLDGVDDSKLEREGRHGTLKIMSVAQILRVVAMHELTHGREIAHALGIEVADDVQH